VIGRDAEIEQTVEILSRRRKNNAVLIGEAGLGMTAIAEDLARRIREGDVPERLHGHRVVALHLAGSQFRGQCEQRLKSVLEEAARPEAKVVLFIDELHTVLGAGAAEVRWTRPTSSSRYSLAVSCASSARLRSRSSARSSATPRWRGASRR
jgi:ATP-dependent Clp protease ATP-binding subunit ClpC